MRLRWWVVTVLLLGLVLLRPSFGHAQTVYSRQEARVSRIAALAINVDRWTGWVLVNTQRSLALEVDYVHGTGTATAVTMRCETSESSATANDAGRDVHVLVSTTAAGVSASVEHTWSNAVAGAEQWTWTIAGIPSPFINCLFRGTAAGAADTVTVNSRGVTP